MEWYDSLMKENVNDSNSDLILQKMIDNLESNYQSNRDEWQLPPIDCEKNLMAHNNQFKQETNMNDDLERDIKPNLDSPLKSSSSAYQINSTKKAVLGDEYAVCNEKKKCDATQSPKYKLRICSTCNCRYATGFKKNSVPYRTCSVCAQRKRRQYLKKKYF